MLYKLISIEKCDRKVSRKIQFYLISFSLISYLLTIFSPFTLFFHKLGFGYSNGCPFYTFSGIPCPACGLGRGFYAILSFNFDKWFYYNPSAPFLVIPSMMIFFFIFIISFFRLKIRLHPKIYQLWYLAVIAIAIVWLLNILFGHVEV